MRSKDYKKTLNLPVTDFPMKANLPEREPQILARWDEQNIYQLIRKSRKGRESWVLHDGPPYANGHLHLGHAVNKILKDVLVKCALLNGYDSPYIPGWDCHGLPIEVNVEKKLGRPRDLQSSIKFNEACRAYAKKWLDIQRTEFKRMGVIGDWEQPYVTMDHQVEANIIRALAKIYKNGHLEQGYKPVHWCWQCQSALAEAEVEYREKISPGISVGFPLPPENEDDFFSRCTLPATASQGAGDIMFVIWTTTPWTIPANRSVTLNPQLNYVLVQTKKGRQNLRLVLEQKLHKSLMAKFGLPLQEVLLTVAGADLEGLQLQHPYYEGRPTLVTLGDYVTAEEGTGLVHSAPAYGIDDFWMAKKYGLELDNPVNDYGKFEKKTPLVGGLHIFKDEERLVELLAESGCLLHNEVYKHQYPHCWRHKCPTIYRATRQWFISMTKQNLIGRVLGETVRVRWTPEWGQQRIESMMKNRPDWCISRQRHWGVPLPFLLHKDSDAPHPRSEELLEEVAKLIEQQGVDAWLKLQPADLLAAEEAADYVKSQHILDVWFDSGTTHYSVLRQRKDKAELYPATMYLEGSDQHRGWFQSSILSGVAMDGHTPYEEVLTHGFTVDSQGHKMSKSLGNIIEPSEVIKRLGADVLRWWVISSDYANEMVMSEDVLSSAADVYRKIRNTARFLLANLYDFNPARHKVEPKRLLSLDLWLLARANDLQEDLKDLYYDYNYAAASRAIHSFCVRELGSFYLEIVKDRQYTMPRTSQARRSAQTAMFHTLEAMTRWLAPLLSFTAEEIWSHLPGKRTASVFMAEWYEQLADLAAVQNYFNAEEWRQIIATKEQANRFMEDSRRAGKIGSALSAEVLLFCNDGLFEALVRLDEELKFFLLSSRVVLGKLDNPKAPAADPTEVPGLRLTINPMYEEKCIRCWHRDESVGRDYKHPDICARCISNLSMPGEKRYHG